MKIALAVYVLWVVSVRCPLLGIDLVQCKGWFYWGRGRYCKVVPWCVALLIPVFQVLLLEHCGLGSTALGEFR